MIAIELPWPARQLWPNARMHWSKKASYTRQARRYAWAKALQHPETRVLNGKRLEVTAVFCPPDARARDDDNMLSACKAYFDGVADVVGDDSRWTLSMRREEPRRPGCVIIELREVT